MDGDEVLNRIRQALKLPEQSRHEAQIPENDEATLRLLLAKLAANVRDIQRGSAQVGVVPQGYPPALEIIMKTIHRLIPWYTRPIQGHAQCSAAAANTGLLCLQEIAKAQERIAERLDRLERQILHGDETGSPPRIP